MSSSIDTANENLRIQQVYSTLLNVGAAAVIDRTPLGKPRRGMQRWIYRVPEPIPNLRPAVRTRLLVENLGPTYVKLGQIVVRPSVVRGLPVVLEQLLRDRCASRVTGRSGLRTCCAGSTLRSEPATHPKQIWRTTLPHSLPSRLRTIMCIEVGFHVGNTRIELEYAV